MTRCWRYMYSNCSANHTELPGGLINTAVHEGELKQECGYIEGNIWHPEILLELHAMLGQVIMFETPSRLLRAYCFVSFFESVVKNRFSNTSYLVPARDNDLRGAVPMQGSSQLSCSHISLRANWTYFTQASCHTCMQLNQGPFAAKKCSVFLLIDRGFLHACACIQISS